MYSSCLRHSGKCYAMKCNAETQIIASSQINSIKFSLSYSYFVVILDMRFFVFSNFCMCIKDIEGLSWL